MDNKNPAVFGQGKIRLTLVTDQKKFQATFLKMHAPVGSNRIGPSVPIEDETLDHEPASL